MMQATRIFTVLCAIVVLIVSGVIVAGIGVSSALQTPSAPEFTVHFVDNSYDVPPKYAVSGYTGQNEIVEAGYHIQNKSIVVTIKNQLFVSYRNENNSLVSLSYCINVKGHFKDWNQLSGVFSPLSSEKEYTVTYIGLSSNNGSGSYAKLWDDSSSGLDNGGQVDIRVQAVIGYSTTIYGTPSPLDYLFGGDGTPSHHDVFTGEYSSWHTETLTIPAAGTSHSSSSSTAATSQPTTTSQQGNGKGAMFGLDLEQIAIIVLIGFVAGLVVVVAFQQRRLGKITSQLQNRA
jgi:hypothetical protein